MAGPFKATCAEGWVKMFWRVEGGAAGPCEGQVLEVLPNCGQEKDIGHQLLWEGDSSAYVAVTTGWRNDSLGRGGPWGR